MKKIYPASAAIIFLGLLLNCDNIIDTEYENQLNICGVLKSDYHSTLLEQRILVSQTYEMNEKSEPWIDDASVILSAYAQQYILHNIGLSFYSNYLEFAPGDTISITVARQGLDTLYGSTVIPGPISVLHPTPNDTVSFSDSILLRICANGALYYGYGATDLGRRLEAYYLPDENDSLIIIPLQGFGDYLGPGLFHFLFVVFDSNYYNYFIDNDSIVSAGVTGGIGLFGSSYMTETWFELVE